MVLLHVLRIDFRDDQRHIRVHPERRGAINKHTARLDDGRGQLLRDVVLCGAQDNVDTFKCAVARFLDLDRLAAERHGLPGASGAGQRAQLRDGEAALFQDLHHFLADGARRAQDCYIIFLHSEFLLS